ncbi:hypothetical protein HRbin30_02429 [bacterium HR30]|nr:hypothetical protein HRbin30_02429 [bacterium HR30]
MYQDSMVQFPWLCRPTAKMFTALARMVWHIFATWAVAAFVSFRPSREKKW